MVFSPNMNLFVEQDIGFFFFAEVLRQVNFGTDDTDDKRRCK